MRQPSPWSRRAAVALSMLLAAGFPAPARAYQTYGTTVGNQVVTLKWKQMPVRYFVTDRGVAGVTSSQFRDAAGRAFATWQGISQMLPPGMYLACL